MTRSHFCNPSQGLSRPNLSFAALHHPSTYPLPSLPVSADPCSSIPPDPEDLPRLFSLVLKALHSTAAAPEALREVSVCLPGLSQSCVLPCQTSSTSAAGPQTGSGGGPIGLLSHCVSHSSCGPLQASWAVGDTPALGARLRWKPSSVPTLLGKSPPLLGCMAWGWDIFT